MGIGLQVNERDVVDPPRVRTADLGISSWAVKTRRGPIDKPYQFFSQSAIKKAFFGEPDRNYESYYVLTSLYKSAGKRGANVWLKRVVGAGYVVASNTADAGVADSPAQAVSSINNTFPLRLASGDALDADVEGVGTQTATFTGAPAELTGAAATYAAVVADNTLDLSIDGVIGTVQVIFAGTENTQALFLAAINAQITGAKCVDAAGELKLITDIEGTDAGIEVLASSDADVLASTGLSASSDDGSGNVADVRAVTFTEAQTIFEAAFTNGDGVNVVLGTNSELIIETVATGASETLEIIAGKEEAKFGLTADTYTGGAGSPASIWQVKAGYRGQEDPGSWANDKLYYQVVAATSGLSTERDLLVYYQTDADSSPVLMFRHKNLTKDNVEQVVNHSDTGSEWVTIVNLDSDSLPDIMVSMAAVSDGTAGADGATPAEAQYDAAFDDFNGKNYQLLCASDLQTLSHAVNMEAHASTDGKITAIFQAPMGISDVTLGSTFSSLLTVKSFLTGYRGYIKVSDELGGTIWVPSIGAQVGSGYIRKPQDRGGHPHIAPAGPSANFKGVIDVDDPIYDQDRLQVVNATGFNPIVYESGFGFFAKTSRTFSTQDKWYSVHVRIQANYFKVSFLRSFGILEQEGNNTGTRRKLRRSILRFLENQYDNGGLDDEGGFENNASVKCDTDNNAPEVRNARKMVCDVTYRPVEIAENIEINLFRTTEGLLGATEA